MNSDGLPPPPPARSHGTRMYLMSHDLAEGHPSIFVRYPPFPPSTLLRFILPLFFFPLPNITYPRFMFYALLQ
jgi:hypothetical protein